MPKAIGCPALCIPLEWRRRREWTLTGGEFIDYAVIGTGAVGGYYGGLLARRGHRVHFLLHNDYAHVREHGLRVDSKNGDFLLRDPLAYASAKDMPRCDIVLVALKTTQNQALSSILPHVVKDGGIVVMLQNGLGVEREAADIVPRATVLGGLCFLCKSGVVLTCSLIS